ncbi:MAG: molybdopterin-synthase adenylyltransferase MoeB [Planctomycetaceae bacterium]|jgi:adenylyltransferase/sulfurtransferase|nr:molybdopterin-synthase adenylyltransferase MoeB [Planctomycetaceae bacterium]
MSYLSHEELTRYSRHLILPEVGIEGQQKIKDGKVLVVGTGGLGSPIAMYLAAAGIGTLGIIDYDTVDETNLQRQIIHTTRDLDRPKVASAKDKLEDINPFIKVNPIEIQLNSTNALKVFKDYDVIVDGTDNFATRYLINDACVLLDKPNVYGSVFRFEGQATVFHFQDGPCLRCLYPEPPPAGLVPTCSEGGVLGVLPGIIGCIQANETLKILLQAGDVSSASGGETLSNRLLLFDAWKMRFRELKLRKDPQCPICGKEPSIKELIDYEEFCGLKKHVTDVPIESIDAVELKRLLDNEPETVQIIDIREPHEIAMGVLPRSKSIPFGQVVRRKDEFDTKLFHIFICKIGIRSELAIRALRDAGFEGRLANLKNGTNSWAKEIDDTFAVY